MESSYMKLLRGSSRITNHLGLQMAEGYVFSSPAEQSRDYAYIEIPVKELYKSEEEPSTTKGARSQYLRVVPACSVNVKGHYRFEVHPNPKLYEYGMVQAPFYIEPDSGLMVPYFHIALRKDLDISDIGYAIRIYMRV